MAVKGKAIPSNFQDKRREYPIKRGRDAPVRPTVACLLFVGQKGRI